MERETGLEPVTSSLGISKLETKNIAFPGRSGDENTAFSPCALFTTQTEHTNRSELMADPTSGYFPECVSSNFWSLGRVDDVLPRLEF
jgi:hypothetical protein